MPFFRKIYLQFVIFLQKYFPLAGVPVLLYHSISNDGSKLSVSPDDFRHQLDILKRNGYGSLSLSELQGYFSTGHFPRHKVLVTFDDGFRDNYDIARPLLAQYGFKAIFFISGKYINRTADFCTDNADKRKLMMTVNQLVGLQQEGHEIANHFFSHRPIENLSDDEIEAEYFSNKNILAGAVGSKESLNCVAYPRNKKARSIFGKLKEIGVKLGFGGRPGVCLSASLPLDIERIQVYRQDSSEKFLARLSPYYYFLPRLLAAVSRLVGSKWFWLLLFLAMLRILFFNLSLAGWPADGAMLGDWWTVYGGDELVYFKTAKNFFRGILLPDAQPIGFPLFLAPFIALLKPDRIIDIFPLISFVNGVIIYSLSVVLVYFLSKEIFISKVKSYLAALLFTIYPYGFYFLFKWFVPGGDIINPFVTSRFMQLMFWPVASDPLATLLLLATLLVVLKLAKQKITSDNWAILLGFLASAAFVTRIQNILILPLYFFILIVLKKIRPAIYFVMSALPLLFMQLYVNFASRGSIFKTSYEVYDSSYYVSWIYVLRIFTYPLEYGWIIFVPLVFVFLFMIYGFYLLIKRQKLIGWLVLFYFIANTILLPFIEPTFRNPRYFLPIVPIMIILFFISIEGLINLSKKYVKTK
ncbi:MAG TPA: polysaccharide deacetylase family protein [bacterium]|nr:polysaccharide deacetylase family protein [bacterium]HNS33677.1 polysaccharide deacetylase family protein [bacterium]HOH67522.1 polysaccharide deacetylase family protein [bacterium]